MLGPRSVLLPVQSLLSFIKAGPGCDTVVLSDSDIEESADNAKGAGITVVPKQMTSGLGALMANYGSMTESDSDQEPDCEFTHTITPRHSVKVKIMATISAGCSWCS